MLRTTKTMKDKYEKIQRYLYDLIPEKWESIYLYASIMEMKKDLTGEMYFYYIPKSLIKKKPVNVYEVPKKFNIDETEYLKLVEKLYQVIKDLREDFKETEQKVWTNITITLADSKFKIEFKYDKLKHDKQDSYIRHIIWRYQYLHLGGEIKEERNIIEEYLKALEQGATKNLKTETYETEMFVKKANNLNNIVGFDKEILAARERQKEQEIKAEEMEIKRKLKEKRKKEKEEEKRLREEQNNKNQILS